MKMNKNIISAKFLRRPNRFQAYVEVNGEEIMVHVPNTGRCREILVPGIEVLLRAEPNPARKTPYDLIAGYKGDMLINIDSHIPNKVVEEALTLRRIERLKKYNIIFREKVFGTSRFDFKLLMEPYEDIRYPQEYFLEVKGVTYEVNGITKFPDAPTVRGARHLRELVEVKKSGRGAGVLFLIQLDGAVSFSPHDEMDPFFGESLRYARDNGVDIFAYSCIVEKDSITLDKEVPVIL
ncbi:DNA/RNA nuclease SfsA [Clostridium polynesiense]|uniref:DNA/RNA nuclease SfsA n=1 Tax=Clostridium polynesiense TaxID=1325933 RepID=UPI00058F0983|nr:DNA/RNA nuclease SfsA [Clostridium polynesiense]